MYENASDFHKFASTKLGCAAPDYVFDLRQGGVNQEMQLQRFKKKSEGADEIPEEQVAEQKRLFAAEEAKVESYLGELIAG